MKALRWSTWGVMVAAVGLFIAAIWTDGGTQVRFAATGAVVGLVGAVLFAVLETKKDEENN